MRRLKDIAFLLFIWPLFMVICALGWDEGLLVNPED